MSATLYRISVLRKPAPDLLEIGVSLEYPEAGEPGGRSFALMVLRELARQAPGCPLEQALREDPERDAAWYIRGVHPQLTEPLEPDQLASMKAAGWAVNARTAGHWQFCIRAREPRWLAHVDPNVSHAWDSTAYQGDKLLGPLGWSDHNSVGPDDVGWHLEQVPASTPIPDIIQALWVDFACGRPAPIATYDPHGMEDTVHLDTEFADLGFGAFVEHNLEAWMDGCSMVFVAAHPAGPFLLWLPPGGTDRSREAWVLQANPYAAGSEKPGELRLAYASLGDLLLGERMQFLQRALTPHDQRAAHHRLAETRQWLAARGLPHQRTLDDILARQEALRPLLLPRLIELAAKSGRAPLAGAVLDELYRQQLHNAGAVSGLLHARTGEIEQLATLVVGARSQRFLYSTAKLARTLGLVGVLPAARELLQELPSGVNGLNSSTVAQFVKVWGTPDDEALFQQAAERCADFALEWPESLAELAPE